MKAILAVSGTHFAMERLRIARLASVNALVYGLIAGPLLAQATMQPALIAASLVLVLFLSLLSAIDLVSLRLPDMLTIPLLLAGLCINALGGTDVAVWHSTSALIGGLSLYLIGWLYHRYRGLDGLGLGDAKLFAAAGAWIGAEGLSTVLLVACGSALVAALVWQRFDKSMDGQTAIPFGPFLAFGFWVVWLYGPLE